MKQKPSSTQIIDLSLGTLVRHPKLATVRLHLITDTPGRALNPTLPSIVPPPEEITIVTPISPTTTHPIPTFDSHLRGPWLLSTPQRMAPLLDMVLCSHRCHSVLDQTQVMEPWEWGRPCPVNLARCPALVIPDRCMEEADMAQLVQQYRGIAL